MAQALSSAADQGKTVAAEPARDNPVLELEQALHRREALIIVTSDSEGAHSVVVQKALARFDRAYASVVLTPEIAEPVTAVDRLLDATGTDSTDKPEREKQVALALLIDHATEVGRPLVVVIDDAHLAAPAQLEKLRMALRITPGSGRAVLLVLAGSRKLVKKLRKKHGRGLWTRATTHVRVTNGSNLAVPDLESEPTAEAAGDVASGPSEASLPSAAGVPVESARPASKPGNGGRWLVALASAGALGAAVIVIAAVSQRNDEASLMDGIGAQTVESVIPARPVRPADTQALHAQPPSNPAGGELTAAASGAKSAAVSKPTTPTAATATAAPAKPAAAKTAVAEPAATETAATRAAAGEPATPAAATGKPTPAKPTAIETAAAKPVAAETAATKAAAGEPTTPAAATGKPTPAKPTAADIAAAKPAAAETVATKAAAGEPATPATATRKPTPAEPTAIESAATRAAAADTAAAKPAATETAAAKAAAGEPTTPAATSATAAGITLQMGAFRVVDNANKLRDDLTARFADVRIKETTAAGKPFYRVQMGPMSADEAVRTEQALSDYGYVSVRIPTSAAQ